MPIFNSNVIIKEMRKAKGLTQEQLAEGICSRSTITMIEQGKRKPDWYTFESLMNRLGIDAKEYFNDIASEDEVYFYNQLMAFRQLRNLLQYDKLKLEMEKIENDPKFKEGLGRRVYRECCRIYYSYGPYKNLELALKYVMEAIKENRPDFDINEIQNYFLSEKERAIITTLGTIHGELGDLEKSIKIIAKLIKSYEKNYSTMDEVIRVNYCTQFVNLAATYAALEQYEKCLEAADKGLAVAQGFDMAINHYMYSLCNKAYALISLGRKDEGYLLYKRYFLYIYSLGKEQHPGIDFDMLKQEFEKTTGDKLDLSVPW